MLQFCLDNVYFGNVKNYVMLVVSDEMDVGVRERAINFHASKSEPTDKCMI